MAFRRGRKFFEVSNHLGNVLTTLSDRKLQVADDSLSLDHYFTGDVRSAQDYYAFGMIMPGRSFSNGGYRFGFNGKEQDPKVSGTGNQYDYGFRIYNPRIAKFLSVDPVSASYPMLTPYQFASNTPIMAVDLDGLEAYISINDIEVGDLVHNLMESGDIDIAITVAALNTHIPYEWDQSGEYMKAVMEHNTDKYPEGVTIRYTLSNGEFYTRGINPDKRSAWQRLWEGRFPYGEGWAL